MATILLVDDSPVIRSVVKIYLQGGAHAFLEASDGQRALAVLKLVPVDLVVVDINMPLMNGLVFLEKLRAFEDPAVRTLPVILLTGDKDPELAERAAGARADAFLKKPVNEAALKAAVGRLLPHED